jgi:hypothetical protein
VQIAALSTPRLEEFSNLMSIGKVYSKQDRSIYKIRVGVFPTEREAQTALASVRSRGYPDAFIVPETGGSAVSPGTPATAGRRPGEITYPENPFPGGTGPLTPPAASTSGAYKIQLAAYRDARWFDASKIASAGGVVEERKKGVWTVKYLGGFSNLTQAQQALRTVRAAGFDGAFIVREEGGELIKVN